MSQHETASQESFELSGQHELQRMELCRRAADLIVRVFDQERLPTMRTDDGANVSFEQLPIDGAYGGHLDVLRYRYPTQGKPGDETYLGERETWFVYDPIGNRFSEAAYDKQQENALLESDDFAAVGTLRREFKEHLVNERCNLEEISLNGVLKLNRLLGDVKRTAL